MDDMRTRLTYSTVALGAVLALAGCSGSTEPDASPTSETTTTEASPTTEPEPTDAEPDAETETDTETTEPDPPAGGGDLAGAGDTACLAGTWLYTGEEFERTFVEMMSQAGGPSMGDITVKGDSTMTFDGSTLTQEYTSQEVTIDVDTDAMDMSMVMTMTGKTTGSYTVEGDIITITDVDTSDYQVASKVLVDGAEMPGLEDLGLDDVMSDVGTAEGTVQFGCVGDELTLMAIVPEMPDFSFGYTLTRQ